MPSPQGQPRAKSAFAAAFLSLIFPGLGHAYAGVYTRALAFAAPLLLFLALVAGIGLRMDRGELAGLVLANLGPILLVNVVLLLYRLAAIVDAWRVTTYINAFEASGAGRLGRPRILLNPVSVAGLAAVILVMAGAHVVVARYDLTAMTLVNCVFDAEGTANCDEGDTSPGASSAPSGGSSPSASAGQPSAPDSVGSPLPSQSTLPAWNGKDRLNILLVGVDQRPNEGTFNTDTMIVVSIDPTSGQVAMFSLPRDTVDVPTPPGPDQRKWPVSYPGKINSWYLANQNRADFWPGPASQRGYTALKSILGNLYGLNISYYVQVNFDGFRKVIDTMGGVTINVQNPVVDDRYPGDNGTLLRVYIPAGVQHMDGTTALIYARSRHASDDFDRGARQQRVLVSLREQTDVAALVPRLDSLVDALKTAVHTDIPVGILPQLLSLAEKVDTKTIRSYVFAPPLYGHEVRVDPLGRGDVIEPNVSKIRAAVRDAFTADPAAEAQREKLANEGATAWVLNGTGNVGQASRIAGYLDYEGLQASAPNQRAPGSVPATTRIVVYNGADAKLQDTIAYLQGLFGVQVTTANDPTVGVDIIITTGRSTPTLTPPPLP